MTKPLHCMAWYIWYHANSRAQSFHSLHTSLSLDRGEKEVSNNLGVIVWDFLQRSCVLLSLIITGDFKILLVRPKFSIGSPKSIDLIWLNPGYFLHRSGDLGDPALFSCHRAILKPSYHCLTSATPWHTL